MVFSNGPIDPNHARFLSDYIPGVMNLRKITHQNEILFRRAETDDLFHMDQLHVRIAQLERALAQADKTRPDAIATDGVISPPLTAIPVIDAGQLVSGAEQGGLIEAVPIVADGRVPRRRPLFVDSRAVPRELRDQLEVSFAQEYSSYPALHLLSLAEPLVVGQGSVPLLSG
jgi:hypothetical protein